MSEPDRVREAYRHCEELVRMHEKDRFLAALFAPADRRPYLFALYAFDFEIGRVKSLVREPMAGMIRLQWWHEAISGWRSEEAAASPVMIALQDAARQTGVSLMPLTVAVEARETELQGTPAVAAAAVVLAMAARLLGTTGDAIQFAADNAARAMTFVETDAAQAREAYRAFRGAVGRLPDAALPAFLPAALVPLGFSYPNAPQWRRQIVLLRTAWFGFPKL